MTENAIFVAICDKSYLEDIFWFCVWWWRHAGQGSMLIVDQYRCLYGVSRCALATVVFVEQVADGEYGDVI